MKRKITELRPHPKNLEIYGAEQVTDDFLASIKAKGVMVPLTVKADGTIISGHRRYEAAMMAGLEAVPVGVATFDNELDEIESLIEFNRQREKTFSQKMKEAETLEAIERERAKVRQEAGNNQHRVKEILPEPSKGQTRDKVAKQTGIGSGKTYDAAKDLIKRVRAGDEAAKEAVEKLDRGEITIHGAKKELLAADRAKEAEKKESEKKEMREKSSEIEAQQVRLTRKIKQGDIVEMGRHVLYCGSAYEISPKADAIITDPPYGIDYRPDWKKWNGASGDFKKIQGDAEKFDPQPFLKFDTMLFFGANYYSDLLPIGGWLVWDKRLDEKKDAMFGSPFELAWFVSTKTEKRAVIKRILHGGVVNADSESGNNEKRAHPTQKPIALFAEIIKDIVEDNKTILDPFAGSGAVLLACEMIGRKCISIEIEPEYCELIVARWEKMTGKKAAINGRN